MGLLYPFPISIDELDFVTINKNEQSIQLKSYGLPYIFWIYALASLIVYSFMMLGIHSTVMSLLQSTDSINKTLAICFIVFAASIPLGFVFFFFYQKTIISNKVESIISIEHRILGVRLNKTTITFNTSTILEVSKYLSSPNQAKINQEKDMRGFQNKGYFTLTAKNNNQVTLLDRSSNKSDLTKIKNLLEYSFS